MQSTRPRRPLAGRCATPGRTRIRRPLRRVRTLGRVKACYEQDGLVCAIDLRGGRPHAPVQLSSAAHGRLRRRRRRRARRLAGAARHAGLAGAR